MHSFPYKSSVWEIYLPDTATRDKSGGEKIKYKILFIVMDLMDLVVN